MNIEAIYVWLSFCSGIAALVLALDYNLYLESAKLGHKNKRDLAILLAVTCVFLGTLAAGGVRIY